MTLPENITADTAKRAPQSKRKRKWRIFVMLVCVVALLGYGASLYERLTSSWQITRVVSGFVDYGSHETKFSPDGTLIAIAHGGESKVLDWATGNEISHLEQYNGRGISDFSSDGRIVGRFPNGKATDREAFIWNASNGRLIGRFKLPKQIKAERCWPFFSPDNKKIVAVCEDGLITWDSSDLNQIGRIKISQNKDPWLGTFMSWHPTTHEMIAVDADGKLLKVDLQKETAVPLLTKQERAVKAAQWSPDGTRLVTTDREGGDVSVWDVQARVVVAKLPGKDAVYACFSPDGERIVTTAMRSDVVHAERGTPRVWDRRTCAWDAKSGKIIQELPTTGGVAFSPDWSFWAAGGPEGVRIARFDGSELCVFSNMFDGHGSTRVFSKDNRCLAYVNASGLVIVMQHNDPISWFECFALYQVWMIVLAVAGFVWCVRR